MADIENIQVNTKASLCPRRTLWEDFSFISL